MKCMSMSVYSCMYRMIPKSSADERYSKSSKLPCAGCWLSVLQHYLAIKSLHSYTCYLISLQQAHMTAEEIVAHINVSELYGGLLA